MERVDDRGDTCASGRPGGRGRRPSRGACAPPADASAASETSRSRRARRSWVGRSSRVSHGIEVAGMPGPRFDGAFARARSAPHQAGVEASRPQLAGQEQRLARRTAHVQPGHHPQDARSFEGRMAGRRRCRERRRGGCGHSHGRYAGSTRGRDADRLHGSGIDTHAPGGRCPKSGISRGRKQLGGQEPGGLAGLLHVVASR